MASSGEKSDGAIRTRGDTEQALKAAWEPQYEVFYHEGVSAEQLSEVTGMPDPKYSGIVRLKNWSGTGTKVFRASAPKRSGYYFVGWSTRVAPRALAAEGLISGGDVITVDSSVILTAQWTKKPTSEPDRTDSPGTGESSLPLIIAFNLAVVSMLAAGGIFRRRRAHEN